MIELLNYLKPKARKLIGRLFAHRALYGGLAACHGATSFMSDKPVVYVAMTALYALLAWRAEREH